MSEEGMEERSVGQSRRWEKGCLVIVKEKPGLWSAATGEINESRKEEDTCQKAFAVVNLSGERLGREVFGQKQALRCPPEDQEAKGNAEKAEKRGGKEQTKDMGKSGNRSLLDEVGGEGFVRFSIAGGRRESGKRGNEGKANSNRWQGKKTQTFFRK